MTTKTILIVEDEPTISFNFKFYCNVAIEELRQSELCAIEDVNIVVAESLDTAWKIFQSGTVFLISLDLNLNDDKTGREVSGMLFLRELRERGEHTMVLVASSETNMSNSTEALQKHKAIGYYIKSELKREIYQKAIESALFYQNAAELLSNFDRTGNPASIHAAQESLQRAKQAAELADITYGNFPEDLEVKSMEKQNTLDASTELPASESVEEVFRQHIIGKKDWTVIKAELLNLDRIDPAQIALLLKQSGYRLRELPVKFEYTDAFVGSYPIQYRPIFVVVVFHNAKKDYPEIADWVSKEFEEDAKKFTDHMALKSEKQKAGFESKPKIELKAWHSDTTEFFDLHQVINELGSK